MKRRSHSFRLHRGWTIIGIFLALLTFSFRAYGEIAINLAECERFGRIYGEGSAQKYEGLLKDEICKYHPHEPMCSNLNPGEQQIDLGGDQEICVDKTGHVIISCELAYTLCTQDIEQTCRKAFTEKLDNGRLGPYFESSVLRDNREANSHVACAGQDLNIAKIDFSYVKYNTIFCKVNARTAFYFDRKSNAIDVMEYKSDLNRFTPVYSSHLYSGPAYFTAGIIINSVYRFEDYVLTVTYRGYPAKSIQIRKLDGEDTVCFPGKGDNVEFPASPAI